MCVRASGWPFPLMGSGGSGLVYDPAVLLPEDASVLLVARVPEGPPRTTPPPAWCPLQPPLLVSPACY